MPLQMCSYTFGNDHQRSVLREASLAVCHGEVDMNIMAHEHEAQLVHQI